MTFEDQKDFNFTIIIGGLLANRPYWPHFSHPRLDNCQISLINFLEILLNKPRFQHYTH